MRALRLLPIAAVLLLAACDGQTPVAPTQNVVIETPEGNPADQCPRNDGTPCR